VIPAPSFSLTKIQPADVQKLQAGTFIVLLDPVSAPPHLLVSAAGILFSLTVNGPQPDEPVEKLFAYIGRKKLPAFFIEWKIPQGWNVNQVKTILRKSVNRHLCVEAGKVSCLFPVREAAAIIHGAKFLEANFIFELLPMLDEQEALGTVYAFHYDETDFELKRYSSEELRVALVNAARGLQND
jgi:hypothetical protein